jgi:hypothetical protein
MTKRPKRNWNEEFKAIERCAMGPVEPPKRVEVGSEESGFDEPPAR